MVMPVVSTWVCTAMGWTDYLLSSSLPLSPSLSPLASSFLASFFSFPLSLFSSLPSLLTLFSPSSLPPSLPPSLPAWLPSWTRPTSPSCRTGIHSCRLQLWQHPVSVQDSAKYSKGPKLSKGEKEEEEEEEEGENDCAVQFI